MSAEADRALGKAQGGNNSQGPIYRVPVSPGSPSCCLLCLVHAAIGVCCALDTLASCFQICLSALQHGTQLLLQECHPSAHQQYLPCATKP